MRAISADDMAQKFNRFISRISDNGFIYATGLVGESITSSTLLKIIRVASINESRMELLEFCVYNS